MADDRSSRVDDTAKELDVTKLLGFDQLDPEGSASQDLEEAVASAFNKIGESSTSDRRLKRDIVPQGTTASGIRLYRYRYVGSTEVVVGVMAQDLLEDPRHAHAVTTDRRGYLTVNYQALGLAHLVTAAMRQDGRKALATAA